MLERVLEQIDRNHDAAVDRLVQWLRIPSVSTDPQRVADIAAAAEFTRQRLDACGLATQLLPTAGHPSVFGDSHPDATPGKLPTVLFYGHYDVQPAEPLDLWKSPPFSPEIRDASHGPAVFARGASDDKGQVAAFLEALLAWKQVHGHAPLRVKALIEGEEEIGSIHLPPVIEAQRDLLRCDTVLVSDTSQWEMPDGTAHPAITYGLRGLVYFDIQLHGASRDLHSGIYGGTLANPATVLTRILGQLFDDQHRVTIPGFYKDVVDPTSEEHNRWSKLGFDGKHFLREVGVDTEYGEAGFTTLERKWCRPACDINGVYGGFAGKGAKTVLPNMAGAKVSFRLAPSQDPLAIADAFEHWLRAHDTHGLRWQITRLGEAPPVLTPTDAPQVAAVSRAVEQVTGKAPPLVRDGATIPIVADLQRVLDVPVILLGFGRADDALHAPNEKFDLAAFRAGTRCHAAALAHLSGMA